MPSKEAVQKALAAIKKRPANYDYFFGRLESADWLAPLRAEGLFKDPPAVQRMGDMISFPGWPEARYLARVAPKVPDLVLEVLLALPETDNVRVHDELVSVALALPPKVAARWTKREVTSIRQLRSLYFLPERLAQLIVHLANGGEAEAAFALARFLFETAPDTTGDASRFFHDVRVKMSDWEYGDLLRRCASVLITSFGDRGLRFLIDLLARGLGASTAEKTAELSWIARPSIEDHEQNIGQRPLDDLVVSVRDGAEKIISSGVLGATQVAQLLMDYGGLLARIGIHLLAKFGARAPDLVAACLRDRAYFESVDFRHEYDQLLEAEVGRAPQDIRDAIVGWIDAGPGPERVERWRNNGMSDDEVRRGVQLWQRDRLYPMRMSLPDVWKRRYEELVTSIGPPEHPGFTSYRRTFAGPTTPKSADDLRAMTVDEILQLLVEWKPTDDWMEASQEGLGRELEKCVAGQPARFAPECARFASTDATYVRSLLAGFAGGIQAATPFEWAPVLKLCGWVLEQPREIPNRPRSQRMDRDPDWGWTRKQIADLLVAGLRASGPPLTSRNEVWRLLSVLSGDSDPSADFSEQSSMDPVSQSLNTVRSQAMHAVMYYTLWLHNIGEEAASDSSGRAPGLPPEVTELLDARLDPQAEPAVAVRAVYGRWLPTLAEVDAAWVAARLERIFPTALDLVQLRLTAWESYLGLTRPSSNLFALLKEQYHWAIARLGSPRDKRTHFVDPDERLAEHLMILYWQGTIPSEDHDGLLRDFFAKAPAKLREHALTFVGRVLHGGSSRGEVIAPDVDVRLKALLERRLALAHGDPKKYASELGGFGWWFSTRGLDLGWRFTQIKKVLSVLPNLEGDFLVLEELQRHAEGRPLEVLECVEELLRGENPSWLVIGSRARLEMILSRTVRSDAAAVRERAVALIHHLGAIGHSDFRRLLDREDGYAGAAPPAS